MQRFGTVQGALVQPRMNEESSHHEARLQAIAADLGRRNLRANEGRASVCRTRGAVVQGWLYLEKEVARQQDQTLSTSIHEFVARMPPPLSENELLARELINPFVKVVARESSVR